MKRAFLSLGSSIEPREQYLSRALKELGALGKIVKIAPLYQTEPIGGIAHNLFLNSALILLTDLTPVELLNRVQQIEINVGRVSRARWDEREIDIDILFYADSRVKTANLTLPHERFHLRRFVLEPLAFLAPDYVPVGFASTLAELARSCRDKGGVTIIRKDWGEYGN